MVENPNNPILNLDVQKMQSWITPAKLMYEGDKGYNQPFQLGAQEHSTEFITFTLHR